MVRRQMVMARGGKIAANEAMRVSANSMLGRSILAALDIEPKYISQLLVVGVPGKADMEVYISMRARMVAVSMAEESRKQEVERATERGRMV